MSHHEILLRWLATAAAGFRLTVGATESDPTDFAVVGGLRGIFYARPRTCSPQTVTEVSMGPLGP